jgi:hypothetical protein
MSSDAIGASVIIALLLLVMFWKKKGKASVAILIAIFVQLTNQSQRLTELVNLVPNKPLIGEFSTSGAVLGVLTGIAALQLYRKTASRYIFILMLVMTLNLLHIDRILVRSVPFFSEWFGQAGPWIGAKIGDFFHWLTSLVKD